MEPAGAARRVLAEGRDTEILEHGDGLVLRRPKRPRPLDAEAAVMRWARARGYPVPEVVEVLDEGMVLERIPGPSMLDDLAAHPWRLAAHARLLADLHGWLHRLPAPPELARPFGAGSSLVHGDLHPGNVLLSPNGPVVIDWTNAVGGPPGADLAIAWLLMAAAAPPAGSPIERVLTATLRRTFVRRFLGVAGRDAAAEHLRIVYEHRRWRDVNLDEVELAAMRMIVDRCATSPARGLITRSGWTERPWRSTGPASSGRRERGW